MLQIRAITIPDEINIKPRGDSVIEAEKTRQKSSQCLATVLGIFSRMVPHQRANNTSSLFSHP